MTSITQCPHCQTRFRVEAFQLNAARGLARCGACFSIFNARRHLLPVVLPEPEVQPEVAEPAVDCVPEEAPLKELAASRTERANPEAEPPDPLASLFDDHAPLDLDWHDLPAETFTPPQKELASGNLEALLRKGRQQSLWATHQRLWWSWGIPALVLVGGILATSTAYITLNFEVLASRESTRPWMAKLCQITGCTLPRLWDANIFQGTDLVVRAHPDFKGALLIEAILQNNSDMAAPFPVVEMRFADVNGLPLASRQFGPGEYLGGGAARVARLMPNKPVAIRMVMLDPGEHAVNYSLNFKAPE